MQKQSFIHFYVQCQKDDGNLITIYHTYDEEEKEYYYKFLDKKKAIALANSEKEASPNEKFRVVKCTETYELYDWI